MKYSIVQARSTYYSDNSHIYFKTHFVWKSVGRPKSYNGGICGKKNKVKEGLMHAYYYRKPVVFRLNSLFCRTEQTKIESLREKTFLTCIERPGMKACLKRARWSISIGIPLYLHTGNDVPKCNGIQVNQLPAQLQQLGYAAFTPKCDPL